MKASCTPSRRAAPTSSSGSLSSVAPLLDRGPTSSMKRAQNRSGPSAPSESFKLSIRSAGTSTDPSSPRTFAASLAKSLSGTVIPFW